MKGKLNKLGLILKSIKDRLKVRLKMKRAPAKLHVIAYSLLGDKTAKFLPLFKDLDKNLERSEIKINFRAYVSLTILATIITSLSTLILTPTILHFIVVYQFFQLFYLG